jgi:two-component system, cell cycle response regulator DivK
VSAALILIVEDNDRNLKLVRDVLQYRGYRTIEAATATDGVRLAQDELPDLVLMDFQLPDMNGIDALQRLRRDSRTGAIPVIAVSASVMPEQRSRIASSGFDAFQAKPIRVNQFMASVAEVLERRNGSEM